MNKHHLIVESGSVRDFGPYVGTRCGLFLRPISGDLYEGKPGCRMIASYRLDRVDCKRCLLPPRKRFR